MFALLQHSSTKLNLLLVVLMSVTVCPSSARSIYMDRCPARQLPGVVVQQTTPATEATTPETSTPETATRDIGDLRIYLGANVDNQTRVSERARTVRVPTLSDLFSPSQFCSGHSQLQFAFST